MEMIRPRKVSRDKNGVRQTACLDVLRRERILHLGMFHAPPPGQKNKKKKSKAERYPFVVPLFYGFEFEEEPVIYLHLGLHSDTDERLRAIESNPRVFFTVESNLVPGLTATEVNATLNPWLSRQSRGWDLGYGSTCAFMVYLVVLILCAVFYKAVYWSEGRPGARVKAS